MQPQVYILSRKSVNELIERCFPNNAAVVSFYDPKTKYTPEDYKPVDYSSVCKNVFYICIYDIDIEALPEYELSFGTYFPEAKQLAKFILDCAKQNLNIVCQCEYGQSRSAACAAAIKEYFDKSGIEIFADYRYYPNQLIFNKLLDALKRVGG